MTRRRKIILSLLTVAVVVTVLAYLFVLPIIVQRTLLRSLAEAGVRDPQLSVAHVSLFSTRISDFQAGGATSVAGLTVSYTPASLWGLRVQDIRVKGLVVRMNLREGQMDFGTLGDILARSRKAPGATTQPARASTAIPLDRIECTESKLIIETPEGEIELPLAGVLTQGDGKLRLQAEVAMLPSPVTLSGVVDLQQGTSDVHVAGAALDLSTVAKLVKHSLQKSNLTMTGQASLDVRYKSSASGSKLSARLEPQNSLIRLPESIKAATNVRLVKGVLIAEAMWSDVSNMSVKVMAEHVEIRCKELDAEVKELGGTFAVLPLYDARQTLTVGEARIGKMLVTSGMANMRLGVDNTVDIESTAWTWLEGRLSMENVRIVPGQPIDLTAVAKGVDLKQVLETFAADHARGEGRIDARLPVRIDWPRVGFARGSIQSAGKGRLMILKADELAKSIAGQVPKGRQDVQVRTKREIIEALQDFDYDTLEANLIPDGNSLTAKARLAGRGRRPPRRALDMQINLRNLDDLLEVYLGISNRL